MTRLLKNRNTRVVVIGMGLSGISVATLLKRQNYEVFVSDVKKKHLLEDAITDLERHHIDYETGGHTLENISQADFMVISPGVPPENEAVKHATQKGIPIYSEIEVASWFCKAKIIGITGSNGKTTTTSLTGTLIKAQFPDTFVGGNIGVPFSDKADLLKEEDYAVLELSSFQLERIHSFRPHIAVLLNFSPDHLDHHKDYQAYKNAKLRICENQDSDDIIIYNADDKDIVNSLDKESARRVAYSMDASKNTTLFVKSDFIYYRTETDVTEIIPVADLKIRGEHNYQNASAAAAVAICAEIPLDLIRTTLCQFYPLEHRLEFVGKYNGIEFYNDSKATNTDAVQKALMSFEKPVILLAGGHLKESDLSILVDLVEKKVKHVCLFGENRKEIYKGLMLDKKGNGSIFKDMDSAFQFAVKHADAGDIVLLSPMCASFDQYDNFKQRGKHFKKLVTDYYT